MVDAKKVNESLFEYLVQVVQLKGSWCGMKSDEDEIRAREIELKRQRKTDGPAVNVFGTVAAWS